MFPTLDRMAVADAMHPGLVTCSPQASLRTVARLLATYRVHAILVTPRGAERLDDGGGWATVSDLELLHAAETADLDETPVGAVATEPTIAVGATEELSRAARLMLDHGVSHLLVLDPLSGAPVGVLSTLDVARALAGFPETHPVAQAARAR